jgi:hypothetical protein
MSSLVVGEVEREGSQLPARAVAFAYDGITDSFKELFS